MGTMAMDSVRVAVNIRPLITTELLMGCTDCVTVTPGEPQVQLGSHTFTYDHVYGSSAAPSSALYEECVAPLVDSLFSGYNATVLAYGQTGSGKTYTMGTNYSGDEKSDGVIPRVMDHIFRKVEAVKANAELLIRVSFIEIFKEEVFDLLDTSHAACRGDGVGKVAIPARVPIQIRETANGGIILAGVTEAEVCSKQEMSSFLERGSMSRATASTNMNNQSSRSHAIFTISMDIKSKNSGTDNTEEDSEDILSAKLHLVDLAGSERAKRTGADGLRLKEGIHINRGLLALGNVISALGDEKKRKEGVHVPYRDSKLTRLLQDSLGGNSRTVMIACASPADTNAEETINTLKYANRARNIQNKAVINRDPVTAQMQKMRGQLEQLQAELLYFRGGGVSSEDQQVLQHKISLLEARNAELCQELNTRQLTCECLEKRALDAQLEKDILILKLESFKSGRAYTESQDTDNNPQDYDLLKTYVARNQDLEMKLLQLESVSNSQRNNFMDCLDLEDDGLRTKNDLLSGLQDNSSTCGIEEDEKEIEHSNIQDKFGRELHELNKQLEQKEEEMKQISKFDPSTLRQHYEKRLLDMEHEKRVLQKEIAELQAMLANLSLVSDDGAQQLKQEYLKKLTALETQVSELKKKQEAQSQVLRQKQRSEEAAKRLQEEILKIKTQKVQLQHKIKQESEQFRLWKASREKEVLQLKKEGRKNEYEMHKLLALNQRQKMVLQRKTEEASLATKRLKELLDAKKTSRDNGPGNMNGPGVQAFIQAIEHELEVTVRVHEVRSQYGRQLEARSSMANELSKLKDEELMRQKNMSDAHTLSPSARNSRIIALENMLATSSSTLVTMASQLSEAEERERVFSGRGRWNQVRSLPEAKSVMNFLFELASNSRCHLRDAELGGREKDSVIRELKEKIIALNLMVKQLETQRALLVTLDKQKAPRKSTTFETNQKAGRKSVALNAGLSNTNLEEDMDLSESEQSDQAGSDVDLSDEDWVDSRKRMPRKRSRTIKSSMEESRPADPLKWEILDEEVAKEAEDGEKKTCCSCSKFSSCKTKKCECRAAKGFCGQLCGCLPSKCNNREGCLIGNESEEASPTEAMEQSDSDRTSGLAQHGALLLQSALSAKPGTNNEEKEETHERRPLSDIANKAPNSTTTKPSKRKNWRKSVIQIVPVVQLPPNPPPSESISKNEPPRIRENIPLKLPRAMATSAPNNNIPLAERNAKNTNRRAGPVRFNQDADEKENGRA